MADEQAKNTQQWECTICGYIFDPRMHDGVAFEEMPDDWLCPGCGFGKSAFVPRK